MHSQSLQSFLVLVIGALLDEIKTDTLHEMVITWNLGFGQISGQALPSLLLPPRPTSHPVVSHSEPAASRADSRLLFSFILLCADHVRLRVLINHRLGLLDLAVGQGDKWKVWLAPLCHFHSSLDCHMLVGGRSKSDRQRAFSVVTAHSHVLYPCFDFLPFLATQSAPTFQP